MIRLFLGYLLIISAAYAETWTAAGGRFGLGLAVIFFGLRAMENANQDSRDY